jgi:hypothetical protein
MSKSVWFKIAVVAFVLTLTLGAYASSGTATVTVPSAVQINGQQIAAGDYKLAWNGNDANVQVTFKNGKKDESGKELIQRKVALYTQDENRVVTNRFTLTAPKLTVTSPMASIQHGTFKGDLYIAVTDFQLVDATVDGNVYFASADAQKTFKMDETSEITGKQELQK